MDPLERALLIELDRRERLRSREVGASDGDLKAKLEALVAEEHPKARAFLDDASPLVALCGTRRSSKSRTSIRKMLNVACGTPDARVVYINESIAECRRIAWRGNGRDGLLTLNSRFGLGGVPNQTQLTLSFPNGGLIELFGADDLRANDRIGRGGALHLLVVDEAQKAPHLGHLILESAGAAMMDYGGQIVIGGTPSEHLADLFYEVTRDDGEQDQRYAEWSVHRYSVLDNPFFGATQEERFAKTIQKFCDQYGLSLDDPIVQREWFGRWVKTDARFTYAVHQVPEHKLCYAPARWIEEPRVMPPRSGKPDGRFMGGIPDLKAAIADLPKGPDWRFTLFADLGYEPDPFAYVLWAWSWSYDQLLEVASWQELRLDDEDQFGVLAGVQSQVPLSIVGGDIGGANKGMGKGWSRRWNERFGMGMVEAEKSRKFEHQRLFNTDIRKGRALFRSGKSPLLQQLRRVVWLPGELKEDPSIPNDVTDAGLYGHRHTHAHHGKRAEPRPAPYSQEFYDKLSARLEQEDLDELEGEVRSYYG